MRNFYEAAAAMKTPIINILIQPHSTRFEIRKCTSQSSISVACVYSICTDIVRIRFNFESTILIWEIVVETTSGEESFSAISPRKHRKRDKINLVVRFMFRRVTGQINKMIIIDQRRIGMICVLVRTTYADEVNTVLVFLKSLPKQVICHWSEPPR